MFISVSLISSHCLSGQWKLKQIVVLKCLYPWNHLELFVKISFLLSSSVEVCDTSGLGNGPPPLGCRFKQMHDVVTAATVAAALSKHLLQRASLCLFLWPLGDTFLFLKFSLTLFTWWLILLAAEIFRFWLAVAIATHMRHCPVPAGLCNDGTRWITGISDL